MTLGFYVARRFFTSWMTVFGVFLAIIFLVDIVEQLRAGSGTDETLNDAVMLAFLHAPKAIYAILPLIMMLASIMFFLGFARSSEMVIVRASGQSALGFLVPTLIVAMLIGILGVTLFNPLVAVTGREFEARIAERSAPRPDASATAVSVSEGGLWMRQGDKTGQIVIQAEQSGSSLAEFNGVTMMLLSPEGHPLRRIEARTALLDRSEWVLTDVKSWDLSAPNPEAAAERLARETIPTNLTVERINKGFGDPIAIGFWSLGSHIDNLESAGLSARAHLVFFQMELALPLILAAMVLIAAGFTMRHARFGKTGTLVLMALGSGFGIFFLRNFSQVLGENGQIPTMAAAWTPPIAATLLALGLLLHLEDG